MTASGTLVGQAVERVEDAALLSGRGRFADDVPVSPATQHAAFVRSPHARLVGIDATAALAMPGVTAVLTGDDVRQWAAPFVSAVKQPIEHWCLAVDRARYVGEPVAVVVAADRYRAEDAAEAVRVDYEPLPAVVDPEAALEPSAPILHPDVGGNLVSERLFRYGDPGTAFAGAGRVVDLTVRYPRNSATPIEGYVVVAAFDPGETAYDVFSNFQGPFALHPVMCGALKVPGNRLRLRMPADAGGSFGVKQGVFPYIVALCLAARKAGRPVKWVEDRLEHLAAATSATNRIIHIAAAVEPDGVVTALRYNQLEDCGAYLRAPEPATLYRMHGNMTGAYAVHNLEIVNRIVVTNKTPTGLVRGFGGPQVYFALERLMHKIAFELSLDPLAVIRRNLVPHGAFPYRTPAGAVLDSGDYPAAVEKATAEGGLAELIQRRDAARAEGRLYGIGYAAVVEPSISNMGYITTVLTAEERRKAGPKGGGVATATVAVDPTGTVTVRASSPSIPRARSRCERRRRRRVRATGQSSPRWSPTSSASASTTCASTSNWIPPATPGPSAAATIPVASPARSPERPTWRLFACATDSPPSPHRGSTSRRTGSSSQRAGRGPATTRTTPSPSAASPPRATGRRGHCPRTSSR